MFSSWKKIVGTVCIAAAVTGIPFLIRNQYGPGKVHVGIAVRPNERMCSAYSWKEPTYVGRTTPPSHQGHWELYYVDQTIDIKPIRSITDLANAPQVSNIPLTTPYGSCTFYYGKEMTCCLQMNLGYVDPTFYHVPRWELTTKKIINLGFACITLLVFGSWMLKGAPIRKEK